MAQQFDTDVIVGGGGMVGLTLALALGQGGLSVIVADPVPPSAALDSGFDGRVSALSYSSIRMLEALCVWKNLAPDSQPILDILVTDAQLGRAPAPFSLHFDHREIGQPMGSIAENRHIRRALYAAVAKSKNIELRTPAAFRARRRFGAWHPSDCGAGIESWIQGRGGADGSRHRSRAPRARYRQSRCAAAL